MNHDLLKPFITSTRHVFHTVLHLSVDVGPPVASAKSAPAFAVSGVIAVSGDVVGNVSLTFPAPTARRVTAMFTGQDLTFVNDDDIADAIGELAYMSVGGARAQSLHAPFDMSCPSVVMGKGYAAPVAAAPSGASSDGCIALPCLCEAGEFSIDLAFAPGTQFAPELILPDGWRWHGRTA